MTGRKGTRWREKFVLWVLAVALLLPLCTGCARRITGDVEGMEPSTPQWTDVITGVEIDTLNIVLVIDTSASNLRNDPARNWLEASCMFLNTLYASAGPNEYARLPGSKRVNADVILYNDTISLFSDTLMNLASNQTVSALKGFIRNAEIPIDGGGDSALAEALDAAVDVLYQCSGGQEKLSERSLILLFTDGYAEYVSPPQVDAVSGATVDAVSGASAYGESASMPHFGENQEQLETALKRAKERNYTIYVLMSNLNSKSDNGGWDEFKKIANYTQRDLMVELGKVLGTHWDLFENFPLLNDFTWPKDYFFQSPPFLDDPMFGSGVDLNPQSGKVNYLEAKYLTDLMEFYAKLASNALSGSSLEERVPSIEPMIEKTSEGELVAKNSYCYDIETPDSGVSALICFIFSNDGIDNISLKGPDPERPGERIDYTRALRTQDAEGWSKSGAVTMRNEWYMSSAGEKQYNIATLTIMNPPPGLWRVYVRGKDGNRSLHVYTKLVSGAKVNISFAQGNGAPEHPVTGGDIMVQVSDSNGQPLPEAFYAKLKISQCEALRIPPWLPISGESDIVELMQNYPAWLKRTLSDFKMPEKFLTQMSGGQIWFKLGADSDGNPALLGHFDAPLPGMYYVTLNMASGEGASRIDYSKSFWVTYEPKTDFSVIVPLNKNMRLNLSELLPESWRKISNADTPEIEELSLNIDMSSVNPSDLITVKIDSKHPETLVIHGEQKGEGTLSFDVTTEYGDKWTLSYDVIVH